MTSKLAVHPTLRALLPALTSAELKLLTANIVSDAVVTDPILYWPHEGKNLIVDGMHRWEIAEPRKIPYTTRQINVGETMADAELWVLNHQLGRRNLLNPAAVRTLRGQIYNRLKQEHGGDRKSKYHFDTLIGDAAAEVGAVVGVTPLTIKRDGRRVTDLTACVKSVRQGVDTGVLRVSDADIKMLASLPAGQQNAIATAIRKGRQPNVRAAMNEMGITSKATRPVAVKSEAEIEAADAKRQIVAWYTGLSHWLSRPPSIDSYRTRWPGRAGDRVVKLTTELYEALKQWEKAIK